MASARGIILRELYVSLAAVGGLLLLLGVVGGLLKERTPISEPLFGPLRSKGKDVLFLGWFGPIGAAALYYAAFSYGETAIEAAWTVGSLVICASLVVHGVSATPLTKLYGSLLGD
jgi:NhaP-type Na+/H+ or K+/H+ antiporter